MLTVFRWPGGKSKKNALQPIIDRLPDDLDVFCDLTLGGGSVALEAMKANKAKEYVISDLDPSLMRFWDLISDPNLAQQLVDELQLFREQVQADEPLARRLFQENKQGLDQKFSLTPLKFFFHNRVAFSGNMTGGFSSYSLQKRFTKSSISKIMDLSEFLQEKAPFIRHMHWEDALCWIEEQFAGKNVLVYLDPPYPKLSRCLYRYNEFDHEKLSKRLITTKTKFLLSYSDCWTIRKLYEGHMPIETLRIQYGMDNTSKEEHRKGKCKLGRELLISNYLNGG